MFALFTSNFVGLMRYIHKHVDHILQSYRAEMPLANYLKFYFKQHPILGSRDRKLISEMLYCYYRCARMIEPLDCSTSEKVDIALLYCESNLPVIKRVLPEHLSGIYDLSEEKRQQFLTEKGYKLNPYRILREKLLFSTGIEAREWAMSMLYRPKVFIRIRKQYLQTVIEKLKDAAIVFEQLGPFSLALPNGTAIEKLLPSEMYRIQDASSQQTIEYFEMKGKESCWDCCSGAGGKSLLIKELAPVAPLCVSDIRASILENLSERFKRYDLPQPECVEVSVEDKTELKNRLGNRKFKHIIADVPCTGSGTWARTPEQLYFFDTGELENFAKRQENIARNALSFLDEGGTFIYITCSVFAAENEAIVNRLLSKHKQLKLKTQKLINGIGNRADSMFIAVLTNE